MSPSSLSITPGLRVAPGYLHFSRLAPYLLIMSCAAGEVMTVWLCSIASMALHASTLPSRCSWRLMPVYCFLLRMKSIPLSLFTSPLVHLADEPQALVQALLAHTRFYIRGVE